MYTVKTVKKVIGINRFPVIDIIQSLEKDLEEQIQFKKNKEFLYMNQIKRRFYYYRDKYHHPRITVCTIQDPKTKIYCRGFSLCSFTDIIDKEFGRDLTEDRAIKALKLQKNSDKITTFKADEITMAVKTFDIENEWEFKSMYNVQLTEFENKLFSPREI